VTVEFAPVRELPARGGWGRGDVLVLLGELFGRGYAHGILDEARRAGMTIVGATVGRRDGEGPLRALSPAELAEAEAALGGRIVNVPLEAGFDLEAPDGAPSPVELLRKARPGDWESFRLDWAAVERAREAGARRFEEAAARFAEALAPLLPAEGNVLFVHTMAGGFPRARVYMPLMTRVFRGTGEKYVPSEPFMASDLGRLWRASFDEVTGHTLGRLVDATARLRTPSRRVRYAAYGYHGVEVTIGGRPTWQSYVPYLQGWAKLALERGARRAWEAGVRCTVFNAPEVWSNSSALFSGVELALYPLVLAVRAADPGGAVAGALEAEVRGRLREGATLEGLLVRAERYLADPVVAAARDLQRWPQHTTPAQLEAMLAAAEECLAMSADPRDSACAPLSRAVVAGLGRIMLAEAWAPRAPVLWVGHDAVARALVTAAP
jgi:hypothetical protein